MFTIPLKSVIIKSESNSVIGCVQSRESDANEEIRRGDPTANQHMTPATKVCRNCRKLLGLYEFAKDGRYPDGYRTVCRACNVQGVRLLRSSNRVHICCSHAPLLDYAHDTFNLGF